MDFIQQCFEKGMSEDEVRNLCKEGTRFRNWRSVSFDTCRARDGVDPKIKGRLRSCLDGS